jgi:hypothetical protein
MVPVSGHGVPILRILAAAVVATLAFGLRGVLAIVVWVVVTLGRPLGDTITDSLLAWLRTRHDGPSRPFPSSRHAATPHAASCFDLFGV